jgi:hypothetical protein
MWNDKFVYEYQAYWAMLMYWISSIFEIYVPDPGYGISLNFSLSLLALNILIIMECISEKQLFKHK